MYLAIEGAIGVGKTTLACLLAQSFNAELLLEIFEENPFLADFYKDREIYAFQTQIFFLLSRYHQQKKVPHLVTENEHLIADYTFEKDALFAGLNLNGDELDTYHNVHAALAEKLTTPDLIIYLKAETDVLMQRIAHRDRPYERDMQSDYIDELNQAYEDYYTNQLSNAPILSIDTNELNYVASKEDLKWVENRIRQRLKIPPFQATLLNKK